MYRVWIKRACIKSPSIVCDGNLPVTHADFDNISPIWRGYHHQYHHAMHVKVIFFVLHATIPQTVTTKNIEGQECLYVDQRHDTHTQ